MTPPTLQDIQAAYDRAQFAFRAMLAARSYADPRAPETEAYVAAERELDHLLLGAQFAASQAALDELHRGDHMVRTDRHDPSSLDACDCLYLNRPA